MHLALVLGAAFSLFWAPPLSQQNPDRVYAAVRINGQPIPGEVEFPSTPGRRHWLRLEETVLRLRRDGSFAASARFYRELIATNGPRPRPSTRALLSDATQGRYAVRGDSITFHVPRRKGMAGGTVLGRMSGDRLRIRHIIRDGNVEHRVDIELRVDPTIW